MLGCASLSEDAHGWIVAESLITLCGGQPVFLSVVI